MNTEITIIVAMAKNRVIGKNNTIPWHIPEDMRHFQKRTKGHPCIMGRKTWESLLKKPLSGRENIVVSTTLTEPPPGARLVGNLAEALEICKSAPLVYIIGGGSIYKEALPLATKIEVTLIHQDYDGDTYFPEIEETMWKKIPVEENEEYSVITYQRLESVTAVELIFEHPEGRGPG
jgi:dihydrofolate reductase